MHKRKVSFVNPNFQVGPKEYNAYYLPYSSGVIWSYSAQFTDITDNYELGEFIWRRDTIEEAVEKLKDSDVVGFSIYIWNRNYSKVLGRELKKANPNILIVVGGPEPAITDSQLFEKHPYIDICVKQEGEKAFKAILEQRMNNQDYKSITGLLINNNSNVFATGEPNRINDLDEIPSPYLTGVFDKIIDANPDIMWNTILETNRGCPYMCTFCDWGSLTYSKVKKFDIDRVFNELEWTGKHGCDFVSFTDANFGIFPERDMSIAQKLVDTQKKYSNPKSYTLSWAKNQKREVINIVKKLMVDGGNTVGLNLSVQTMNEKVLDIVKRKNLDSNRINEVFDMCEENQIPLFTELILGLPGETIDTWKENFYTLYKAGNHTGITIYQAQLLENAEMNLTQKEQYQIKGSIVYDYITGSYNEQEVREGVEVVFSTKDMPADDMIKGNLFSWFQNTFHINGLTNYISRLLYTLKNIEYSDFYEGLFNHIKQDEWLSNEINSILYYHGKWATDGEIAHPPINNVEIHGWNLVHSTTIKLISEGKWDHVFNIIEDYVRNTYDLEEMLFNDIMTFQRCYVINYSNINNYPLIKEFNHDILGYVHKGSELYTSATYQFAFPEKKTMSLQEFCEKIYLYRRRNFGKAWIAKL